MDAVEQAKSGHPGLPMGAADIATVLVTRFLKFDPADPNWPDRDRFVLSAGHGSMLLYALLHLTGYDLPMEEIRKFRQLHSKTPGHPEVGYTPGVETTTGPLGQGFANAVGMALAEKLLAAQFNKPGLDLVDHHTYVFMGDGCMMEGISHEAASIAGHLKLDNLCWIYDNNKITIEGATSLAFSEDVPTRFAGYGWVPLIGQPDKARTELDTDPNARFNPAILPSDDVALEVYVPIRGAVEGHAVRVHELDEPHLRLAPHVLQVRDLE